MRRCRVFEGLVAGERCAGWCARHHPGLELRELKGEGAGHRAESVAGGVRSFDLAVINAMGTAAAAAVGG